MEVTRTKEKINPTILDLNPYCYFELFKHIKWLCEKYNEDAKPEDMKYVDLINFTVSHELFRYMFNNWDPDLAKRLYLLYVSTYEELAIDFAELYERLKGSPETAKQSYWKSLGQAIEENERLTDVELRYYPETHHREHLNVFEGVMNQLRKKENLKALRLHIAGYTLDNLKGFSNLKVLTLDMKTDIEELSECCRRNGNLRDLSVTQSVTAGRRLTEIVPFCCQVRIFAFKMKSDGDATEYAPLAKMPRLETLRIRGEHEPGTLQPLFTGLSRKEPNILTTLAIDNATVNLNESAEIGQIESLTDLRCRFLEPESIGPLAQLNYLNNLEILSDHNFDSMSKHICAILKNSKRGKKILLPDCLIDYEHDPVPKVNLIMKKGDASEYSSLATLPQMEVLKISGFYKRGSMVKLLEELASSNVSALILDQDPNVDNLKRNGKMPHLSQILLDSNEVAALSKCKSLCEIVCGIQYVRNVELLANLPKLRDLIITSVPPTGSLELFFGDLIRGNIHVLQHFELRHGTLSEEEVLMLSLILPLKTLTVSEVSDIGMYHILGSAASLEKVNIFSHRPFGEVCDDILKVVDNCDFNVSISTNDFSFVFDRSIDSNYLQIKKLPGVCFDPDKLIPLATLEWVESLDIDFEECNIWLFLHTLSTRTNGQLKKIRIEPASLTVRETEELGNIQSLRVFHGKLDDPQSLFHLRHLNFLAISNFTGNRFPACIGDTLDSITEKQTIRLRDRQVSYNKITGHLMIHNSFPVKVNRSRGKRAYRRKPVYNASDFAPLASLKNLKSVEIFGNHLEGTLRPFFVQLASRQSQTLEELTLEMKNRGINQVSLSINSSEIREVASIKSLLRLKCGFSESNHIELLAQLPKLTNLLITTHQVGSLQVLLEKLYSKSGPTLKSLVLQEDRLTPQEMKVMTAIRSACPA